MKKTVITRKEKISLLKELWLVIWDNVKFAILFLSPAVLGAVITRILDIYLPV